jgi:uncharacterized OB-fold protein
VEEIKSIRTPIRLEYNYTAGLATTRFLRGIAEGKLLGQRCIECKRVYVPSRGACARCAVRTEEVVELADRGTVTTFSIVRVPSENLSFDPPYAAIQILLDGADIPFHHVLQECPLEDVRMGMRVEAVWVPKEELAPTMASIRYFRPLDEPDAAFDSYKEHL